MKEYCSHTTPCFKGKEQISAGNVPSFLDIFMLLTHTFIYWNIDSKLEFKSQNFFFAFKDVKYRINTVFKIELIHGEKGST